MEPHVEEQLNFTINKNIEVLIQRIEPLTKQNQANVNISPLLDEFYKNVIQSESYLQSGIFTINFGKAAIFLDHAFYIYSKQIDLLWEMSINSQRRHLSYDVDSEEKVEAQKKLEEKAQKGKRGRKKKTTEDPKKEIDWNKARLKIKKYCRRALANIVEFDFENEMDIAEVDPSALETFKNVKPIKNWTKMYPEKYVTWPYVESNYTAEIDEDCRYNTGNLATNYMDFQFPEIQRKFTHNYSENKKLDTIGCDISDRAFQHYITERGINPCDFTTETCQNFKKYLDKYLISGPEQAHLAEQRKKLCPRRPSILVTRLPDDVVQQHLKPDTPTPGPSRTDSGYSESMEFSDFSEEADVLPKESSTPLVTKTDRLTPANNAEEPKEIPRRREQRKCVLEGALNSKKIEEEEKRMKRRNVIDEDDELPPKKRMRKKEIFKWLKTTTAALKRFEKFFYKHYLTEEGEGDIEMPEFSSDEENDHDTSESQLLQTTLNASQPSADSGFVDDLDSSQNSESFAQSQTPRESVRENCTQENSDNKGRLDEPLNDSNNDFLPNFEVTESDEVLRRYLQWNEHIREELKRYGQNDFDIHEYGTKIINKLSDDKPVRFSEVLVDDSTNDVARYFAAALQLVNTENVQFTNWTQGEVVADLQINLLSRERHHEHLDSYQAPSKEILKEKIKNLRNNETQVDHSTARKTCKRIKLSKNT